jgi:hypothetical protein
MIVVIILIVCAVFVALAVLGFVLISQGDSTSKAPASSPQGDSTSKTPASPQGDSTNKAPASPPQGDSTNKTPASPPQIPSFSITGQKYKAKCDTKWTFKGWDPKNPGTGWTTHYAKFYPEKDSDIIIERIPDPKLATYKDGKTKVYTDVQLADDREGLQCNIFSAEEMADAIIKYDPDDPAFDASKPGTLRAMSCHLGWGPEDVLKGTACGHQCAGRAQGHGVRKNLIGSPNFWERKTIDADTIIIDPPIVACNRGRRKCHRNSNEQCTKRCQQLGIPLMPASGTNTNYGQCYPKLGCNTCPWDDKGKVDELFFLRKIDVKCMQRELDRMKTKKNPNGVPDKNLNKHKCLYGDTIRLHRA